MAPLVALAALVPTWGRSLPAVAVALVAIVLVAAVLAAVHHAEVVAHRVGEPFGSLILAVAVTVIEVGLIVSLMLAGGPGTSELARDTVFAAVMITCNGVLGLCMLIGAARHHVVAFSAEGSCSALATTTVLATACLVLPTFTITTPGPTFSTGQLLFAAVASLVVYGSYVFVQTVRNREYFLSPATNSPATNSPETRPDDEPGEAAPPPTTRAALFSLALLVAALVAVVALAKTISPAIESGVEAVGAPLSAVGVAIALLVLAPETLAAVRYARRNRLQTSINLAFGSAMASIGLTIPVIAVLSIVLDLPLVLGLGGTGIVLLALTAVVGILTVAPGRATVQEGAVHLMVFAAFLFTAFTP